MEKLKALIPSDLRRTIAESTTENLTLTCLSLLQFLQPLPQFQQVLAELTDPERALCKKSREAALELKGKGNQCFGKKNYPQALSFYSQALRHAPVTSEDADVNLVAMLFVNRASSLHKMGLLEECTRDCNRAVVLSPLYAKAWYRRGLANASLQKYEIAIRDLEVSLSMESSSSGKYQIKEELKMVSSHFSSTSERNNSFGNGKHKKSADLAEPHNILLKCVTTPSKGRGMVCSSDIPPASLIHSEEPLSAIVMKSCRETHCHFCFNEAPADVLFCTSCRIPIFCSNYCQEQGGGKKLVRRQSVNLVQKNLSVDVEKHVMDTILANEGRSVATDNKVEHIPEHRHECGGTPWPVVLPPDVVLAGRVIVKSREKRRFSGDVSEPVDTLFVHNYDQIPLDSKLELHVYAIVLSYCLQYSCGSDFPFNGTSVSQMVLLISQIRVNSMAIVHMKSVDGCGLKPSAVDNALTCSIEQVRVGQAIYSTGSLFNHSCQPNIHAYFLSRTLFLRSTEFVPAFGPLELSYGPQVGQWNLQKRHELLRDHYSFNCQCKGCSELNLSDLVINAFQCHDSNCLGAVLKMVHHIKPEDDVVEVSAPSYSCKLLVPDLEQKKDMMKVAYMLFQNASTMSHIGPGYCLGCNSYLDIKTLSEASKRAMKNIKRLKNMMTSTETPNVIILEALESLSHLRSVRHPYSRTVAQAEDIIAEAFAIIGNFEHSIEHCEASIEILEKLYHTNHIIIGHELIKLTSIQLALGDYASALCNIDRLEGILSVYYGSHLAELLPYVDSLKRIVVHAS